MNGFTRFNHFRNEICASNEDLSKKCCFQTWGDQQKRGPYLAVESFRTRWETTYETHQNMEMLGVFIPDPYLEIPRGLSSPKDLWALLVKSLRPRSLVMEAALAPYQWKLGGFFPMGISTMAFFHWWNLWGNMLAIHRGFLEWGVGPPIQIIQS